MGGQVFPLHLQGIARRALRDGLVLAGHDRRRAVAHLLVQVQRHSRAQAVLVVGVVPDLLGIDVRSLGRVFVGHREFIGAVFAGDAGRIALDGFLGHAVGDQLARLMRRHIGPLHLQRVARGALRDGLVLALDGRGFAVAHLLGQVQRHGRPQAVLVVGIVPDLLGIDVRGLGLVHVGHRVARRGGARDRGGIAGDGVLGHAVDDLGALFILRQVLPGHGQRVARGALGDGLVLSGQDRRLAAAHLLGQVQRHGLAQAVLVVGVVPDLGGRNVGHLCVGDGDGALAVVLVGHRVLDTLQVDALVQRVRILLDGIDHFLAVDELGQIGNRHIGPDRIVIVVLVGLDAEDAITGPLALIALGPAHDVELHIVRGTMLFQIARPILGQLEGNGSIRFADDHRTVRSNAAAAVHGGVARNEYVCKSLCDILIRLGREGFHGDFTLAGQLCQGALAVIDTVPAIRAAAQHDGRDIVFRFRGGVFIEGQVMQRRSPFVFEDGAARSQVNLDIRGATRGDTAAALAQGGIVRNQHILQLKRALCVIASVDVDAAAAVAIGQSSAGLVLGDIARGDLRFILGLNEQAAAHVIGSVVVQVPAGHGEGGLGKHVHAAADADAAAAAVRGVVLDPAARHAHGGAVVQEHAAAGRRRPSLAVFAAEILGAVVDDPAVGHDQRRRPGRDGAAGAGHVAGQLAALVHIDRRAAGGIDGAAIPGVPGVAQHGAVVQRQRAALRLDDRRGCDRDDIFLVAVQHHVPQRQAARAHDLHHRPVGERRIAVQLDGCLAAAVPALAVDDGHGVLDIGALRLGNVVRKRSGGRIDAQLAIGRGHLIGHEGVHHVPGGPLFGGYVSVPGRCQLIEGAIGLRLAAVSGRIVAVHAVQVEAAHSPVVIAIVDPYVRIGAVQRVREENVRPRAVDIDIRKSAVGVGNDFHQAVDQFLVRIGEVHVPGRVVAREGIAAAGILPWIVRVHIVLKAADPVRQAHQRRIVVLHEGGAADHPERLFLHIDGIVDAQVLDVFCFV